MCDLTLEYFAKEKEPHPRSLSKNGEGGLEDWCSVTSPSFPLRRRGMSRGMVFCNLFFVPSPEERDVSKIDARNEVENIFFVFVFLCENAA